MKQIRKNIGSNFLFSFIVILIIGLVNIGYPLLIGLLYSAETMGNFSVLFNWAFFLAIPIANGIAPAISRFIAAKTGDETPQINKIGGKITIFYLVMAIIIFPLIGVFVFQLDIFDLLIVISMLIVIILHYLFRYSLQGQERFSRLFKLEIISFAIFLPFMVIFGVLPNILGWTGLTGFHWLFFPVIVYHLAFDILYLFAETKMMDIKEIFSFPEITKKILLYALFVGIGSLFSLGVSQIQIIISDKFLTEFRVGVLGFWDSAIKPISLISVAIGAMTIPRITNLQKSKEEHDVSFVNKINYGLTLLILPIFGLIFLIIAGYPNLFDHLGLTKYQTVIYWIIPIFLCFQVVNNLIATPTISYYSSSERKVIINPIISFAYSLIVIISWIILVPRWDIWGFVSGIAIGSLVFSLAIQITALIITKRKIGMHVFVMLAFYILGGLSLILVNYISIIILLVLWSCITISSVVIGILLLIKVLKNRDYSITYEEQATKTDETTNSTTNYS